MQLPETVRRLLLAALRPGPDPHRHLVARHHALGALRLDEQLRELLEYREQGRPRERTTPARR
ncbi:hypothetical protein ACIO8F_19770 [Streptomyces sp. NPDC087228]|uniref:hypothetical protein n=1 Tax=Streptomyces sp. NPDC087228 TaxID=3365772 RepID=UPI00381AC488